MPALGLFACNPHVACCWMFLQTRNLSPPDSRDGPQANLYFAFAVTFTRHCAADADHPREGRLF